MSRLILFHDECPNVINRTGEWSPEVRGQTLEVAALLSQQGWRLGGSEFRVFQPWEESSSAQGFWGWRPSLYKFIQDYRHGLKNDVYVVPAHRAGTGWIKTWVPEGCLRTGQTCGAVGESPSAGRLQRCSRDSVKGAPKWGRGRKRWFAYIFKTQMTNSHLKRQMAPEGARELSLPLPAVRSQTGGVTWTFPIFKKPPSALFSSPPLPLIFLP